jgi:serine/threonine protein kinase/Tfp pilus assembly protein PilF
MSERDIFIAALNESEPAKRAAFVNKACGQDKALRRRIEDLLREQESLGSFLEQPADGVGTSGLPTLPPPTIESAGGPAEGPGTMIGPYKLLEQIGEGGFGAVFMAEQQKPLRRKVALKILKPGMDSRQVIARFEAERQALAIMDHPNIAKVLDAGTTGCSRSRETSDSVGTPASSATGRPYFVMELVKGAPITEFCDQNQFTPRQRLELFVSVCQAVQHAHQKGIIHRDLKPSNVLVTMQDGTPLVKVIDFGIAKALGQQLTDKTMFTGFAQLVGTPAYMSPEQVALSNVDVDTRSDVYSLGVLLYELLTGTTPFPKERLKEISYDELRRIIREEDPPKPSTRISTLGQASTTISTQRKSDPKRLSQLFRGELDWIVAKALDKDRNRRYESASAFAADVERYLNNDAVQACPPSAWYRLRKFTRRNKAPVLTATLVILALMAGIVGTTIGIVQANAAEAKAIERRQQAEAVADLLESLFTSFHPGALFKGDLREQFIAKLDDAAAKLDKQATDPLTQSRLELALGMAFLGLGEPDKARKNLESASEKRRVVLGPDHPQTLATMNSLANVYRQSRDFKRAFALYKEVQARMRLILGPNHEDTISSMDDLAWAYLLDDKPELAIPLLQRTVEWRRANYGPDSPHTINSLDSLGVAYRLLGDLHLAVSLLRQVVEKRTSIYGADHPVTLISITNLAGAYQDAGELDLAVPLFEQALAKSKSKHGPDHFVTLLYMSNLASAYLDSGRLDLAIPLATQALAKQKVTLEPDDARTLGTMHNLGEAYRVGDKLDLAIPLLKETLERLKAKRGPDHPRTLFAMNSLAMAYNQARKVELGLPLQEQALERQKAKLGPDHPMTLNSMADLGLTLLRQKDFMKAQPLLRECLTISEKKQPDSWRTFDTKSLLGGSLLGEKKYSEAEPFLVQGYEGMKTRLKTIPVPRHRSLAEAAERLVELYDAWGKTEQADEWRQRLGQLTKGNAVKEKK